MGAQTDGGADEQRRRLRWRARRGLLENDLVLTRLLDHAELSDGDVAALCEVLELSDNELMDLILARAEPRGALDTPAVRRVVTLLRTV